jgi:hypothetical protein
MNGNAMGQLLVQCSIFEIKSPQRTAEKTQRATEKCTSIISMITLLLPKRFFDQYNVLSKLSVVLSGQNLKTGSPELLTKNSQLNFTHLCIHLFHSGNLFI